MPEAIDHNQIHRFAEHLVQGSKQPLLVGQSKVSEALIAAYGQRPDEEQKRIIEKLFPWDTSDRYRISQYGVEVVLEDDGATKVLGLGEFIGGVAVACGITPTAKEVEATIYEVGELMGRLNTRNG